ncbi:MULTISPECIES: VgrG-related protein [Cyanophyceae]|uniref:VgrG-related protein n=1 Tax=Cyanophyceae TaxID=3028117 RepID=UPI001686202F|nr:VgrG-related protein [Trichocoleus sp. FACHB-69]MBD1930797.1 VgrG-related protein [Trichocoleus sp. FACHB-69]
MPQNTIRYISRPLIKIDGQDAPAGLAEDILQISVEESLHLPAMFTLVVRNDYFPGRDSEQLWKYDNLFTIGKSVQLGLASSTTEDLDFDEAQRGDILKGEITGIETHFSSQSQAPVIIRGYDVSHRLHRGRYNRSFQNMSDTDIVRQIIGEVGMTAGTIDESGGPYGFGDPVGYVFQENQTNMEFLRERAARHGFELFVQDSKLHFRKPVAGDTLTLKWLQEIHSFQVRVTSAEQVSAVEVRGWDYQNKTAITSSKNSQSDVVITDTEHGKGKSTSTKFGLENQAPKMIVVDQAVYSQKEADKIAQALYNELSGEFVYADAKAEGDPRIRPGRVVELSGMGKYSGKYYVTETRQNYQDRYYSTEFSVRGLRGGDLLTTLSPQTRLRPGQTMLVGIVTNNKDPKKWGRVRVKFPTLTPEDNASAHESNWARVVGVGAGTTRGFDCLPEINDEVLVAFEHGDIHRPYVIGGVWNGKDAPPETVDNSISGEGKVRLRTIKTRVGHKMQFVEEDKDSSKAGVYVETIGGHKLHMNDSDKFVEIKTTDGHYVRLDDQNKKIEIKTKGGHKILIDDQGKKLDITTSGGQKVLMNDMTNSIKMEAVQKISISAPMEILLQSGPSAIKLAPTGIELQTAAKLSVQAGGILDLKSGGAATMKSGAALSLQSGGALSAQSGAAVSVQSAAALSLQAGAAVAIMAAATASMTAPLIRLNC